MGEHAARALAGDAAGRHFTEVVAPAYPGRAREQFLRKLHGKDATDFELEIAGVHGRRVFADVSSVAVRDERRVVGVFGLLQPVHVRERTEVAAVLTPARPRCSTCSPTAPRRRRSRRRCSSAARRCATTSATSCAHSRLQAVALARRRGLID